MDAISLEVLYGKLSSISEEMQLIILKSAHSRMVNEACDATSALLDSEGRNISSCFYTYSSWLFNSYWKVTC